MTDAQAKPIANLVAEIIYQKLITTTGINRLDARHAAVKCGRQSRTIPAAGPERGGGGISLRKKMKTVAIYRQTYDGYTREGTFTHRDEQDSVRSISEQFCERHPNADPDFLYLARRRRVMGRIVDDSERIPFDCGRYKIHWDNGHAAGELNEHFYTEKQAQRAARDWKREMVALEHDAPGRRAARTTYQWEIVEIGTKG